MSSPNDFVGDQQPDSRLKSCGNDKAGEAALERFRLANLSLFKKDDARLRLHLRILLSILAAGTTLAVLVPFWPFKVLLGMMNAFFWFSLTNITIHHHNTHHNSASAPGMKKVMDILYRMAIPNAPKRLNRYTRAHLNHHARPFDETDVDHHYGVRRFLAMRQKGKWATFVYFLELTFIGAHMPGWEDDRYMNAVPLEKWNRKDYEAVKGRERTEALKLAILQWGAFLLVIGVRAGTSPAPTIDFLLNGVAWGWAFPMLLVKNWAHFLGQFQHYDARFLNSSFSINQRTRTYSFPGFLNYLCGGEISGHFLHHLYPEMPYYNVEEARRRFMSDPELARIFVFTARPFFVSSPQSTPHPAK